MEKDQRKPQDPGQPIGQGNPGQGNPGQGNPGQGNPGQGVSVRVRIIPVKAVGPVRTTLDKAIPARADSVPVRTLPDKGSPARAAAGQTRSASFDLAIPNEKARHERRAFFCVRSAARVHAALA